MLISVIDGITNYAGYYLITAFWIYLGLRLLGKYELTFWQSLGFVIALRQTISLFRVPADLHLKKDQPLTDREENGKDVY